LIAIWITSSEARPAGWLGRPPGDLGF